MLNCIIWIHNTLHFFDNCFLITVQDDLSIFLHTYLPMTIKLQNRRGAAQQKAWTSGIPEDNREYKSLRNQTLASLRSDRKEWEQKRLASSNSTSEVWKTAKDIVGWNSSGPPTQLYISGKPITSPKAIASEINCFIFRNRKRS